MMGQTTLEQTKTVLLTSRILMYKRVDFLGTANLESRSKLRVMHIFLSALRT